MFGNYHKCKNKSCGMLLKEIKKRSLPATQLTVIILEFTLMNKRGLEWQEAKLSQDIFSSYSLVCCHSVPVNSV